MLERTRGDGRHTSRLRVDGGNEAGSGDSERGELHLERVASASASGEDIGANGQLPMKTMLEVDGVETSASCKSRGKMEKLLCSGKVC